LKFQDKKLHKTYVKYLFKLYYQELHLISCRPWKGIDFKFPDDDTIVSKHVGVW